MKRRDFVVRLGGAVLAWPLVGLAQLAGQVKGIGFLSLDTASSRTSVETQKGLRTALQRAGYQEGKNLIVEWRFAEGKAERLPALAVELVLLDVALIVAFTNLPIAAAIHATRTIPIVMYVGNLPVESGFVASLARPGGNVTGTAWVPPEIGGKILQLLKEVAPRTARISVLWNPTVPGFSIYRTQNLKDAAALGVSLQYFDATRPEEVAAALDRIAASRPDALYVFADAVMRARMEQIVGFALKQNLVSIGTAITFADTGGLLYYGPQVGDILKRTAGYVDRILRGAKPADLPVELPSKYELVINLKTAKALRITIPQSVLLRTDRVIE